MINSVKVIAMTACCVGVTGVGMWSASASCVRDANPANYCSVVDTFDAIGSCSLLAHKCPDVAIQNPAILRTTQAHSGRSGRDRAEFQCEYQPKRCTFWGCENDGDPATGGCFSEWPAGEACTTGAPVQWEEVPNPEEEVSPVDGNG